MNASIFISIVSIILVSSLTACTKGEKPQEEAPAGQDAPHHSGKLRVRMLPEYPTAAGDLQVVFTGKGNLTYRWEKNGLLIAGEQRPFLSRKRFSRGDSITVVVAASGEEGRASVTIGNSPPQVTSVAVSPENICRGVDITATPAAFDADGDPIRYSFRWIINGQELPGDNPVLKGDRFNSGERVSLKVTPRDDQDAGNEYATQAFTVPNCAPYFVTIPPKVFDGNTYIYEAMAEDPDGDAIGYSLVSAPSGMTINSSTGRLVWKVAGQSGNHDIEIEAKDSKGLSAYQKYTLAIKIQ